MSIEQVVWNVLQFKVMLYEHCAGGLECSPVIGKAV